MSFKRQLIILFIFFKYISCELEEENMLRAFTCLNIISKKLNGEEEALSNSYSPYMLSCFIKITNEQMQTILSGIEEGNEELNSLNEDEIEQLTDVESLKNMPEKELKKYSSKLEKIMKNLEKMNKEMKEGKDIDDRELNILDDDNYNDGDYDVDDDDYDDYDDDEDIDYSNPKKSPKERGFLRILFRAIKKFFNNSNLWFSFLFLIIVYFLLLAMRKTFEEEKIENNDKEIKEKNEKENDNKEEDSKENANKGNANNKEEKEKEKIKKD